MQILAVDTSGVSGSVALIRDNAILSEVIINIGLNHSQTILPAMAQVLESSGVDASAVDLFAVTTGPGSFTGLRIGISLIKGLALSVSKPIAAVSTLDALAMNLFAAGSTICPFIDCEAGDRFIRASIQLSLTAIRLNLDRRQSKIRGITWNLSIPKLF